jgi:hypothetical protein
MSDTTQTEGQTANERIAELDISLESTIALLSEYVEKLKLTPSFENAEDVCPATRIAWAMVYSGWRDPENYAREQAQRLGRMIEEALGLIDGIPQPVDPLESQRLSQWKAGIAFRGKMIELLLKNGPDAVKQALDQRLVKLRDTKEHLTPRF